MGADEDRLSPSVQRAQRRPGLVCVSPSGPAQATPAKSHANKSRSCVLSTGAALTHLTSSHPRPHSTPRTGRVSTANRHLPEPAKPLFLHSGGDCSRHGLPSITQSRCGSRPRPQPSPWICRPWLAMEAPDTTTSTTERIGRRSQTSRCRWGFRSIWVGTGHSRPL